MTIIVFNKPLNEVNPIYVHHPIFSIHTDADAEITDTHVEVKGMSLDRWHGMKIELEHIAYVYGFNAVGGITHFENCYPKNNNTCS